MIALPFCLVVNVLFLEELVLTLWDFNIISTESATITANKGGSYYFNDLDIWRKEDYEEMVSQMAGKLSPIVICV